MTVQTAFQDGMTAAAQGLLGEAVAAFRRVLADDPQFGPAQINLAALLQQMGQPAAALAAIDQALALNNGLAAAHLNRGLILMALKEPTKAEEALRRAIQCDPHSPASYIALGQLALDQAKWQGALHLAERALALAPGHPDALDLAGQALQPLDLPARAEECYRQALAAAPDFAECWANLGILLQETGRPQEAIAAHDRAIALAGATPALMINRAVAKLAAGDLAGGFADYEGRGPLIGCNNAGSRFGRRRWQGEVLGLDETLLIWGEQGVGDELRFAALIPMAIDIVGADRVVIACDKRLVSLLARSFPGAKVCALEDAISFGGPGAEIPSGSLAAIFHRLTGDFSAPQASWLKPCPQRLAKASERLRALPAGLRAGIAWRGLAASGDRGKFYPGIASLLPLLAEPRLAPVALQYGATPEELAEADKAAPGRFNQLPDIDLKDDFEAVAAVMAGLDLVITADTAVKDLAAGLGLPVWCLTFAHDWTTFGRGKDPLQPTRRIFRKEPGADWSGVIDAVAAAISRGEAQRQETV